MLCYCTSARKRQFFMGSLLQHFHDCKESRLADRNIRLRDLYIDPNTANVPGVLHLKDLFVIYIHVISVWCDLDRRARTSGKSYSKSSPHTCMDIPFSFLLIFLERPSAISVHLQKRKPEQNYILVKQEQSRDELDLLYIGSMQNLESKGCSFWLLGHLHVQCPWCFWKSSLKEHQWRILCTSITLFLNNCQ